MGSRPRSPSAYPADARGEQAGGPSPAKRRRTEEPASPGWEAASSLGELTAAPPSGSLTSVVVLATGCALYLALDDVDLLLQPEPTSMLEVSVGDRTLTLVPEALVDSDVQFPWGQGLELVAVLSAPGESIALEQGFFCLAVPEISDQEGADEEQEEEGEEKEGEEEGEEEEEKAAAAAADAEFLSPGMEAAAGSVPYPFPIKPPKNPKLPAVS
ncbi:Proline-rich protein 23A [Camelus dromedarius]|uniref:Proline-rich protein 23A n=1 Tax=Camelus dromedarius TaxID=9838 RepID=A0A5N4EKU1_CAMDR|nr:Proline-rich protein 23A [Camelus dromedarius]